MMLIISLPRCHYAAIILLPLLRHFIAIFAVMFHTPRHAIKPIGYATFHMPPD